MVACLLSLLVAHPFVTLVYGATKADAVPVFVLISFSTIIGMGLPVVRVLFHYFFKPQYVTLVLAVKVGAFLVATFFLHSLGAVGIAVALVIATVASIIFSFALLQHEFRHQGITVGQRVWRTFGYSPLDR